MTGELVVFRGGGEMASAAARLLFLCGFPVVVLERATPLAVRRRASFAEAVLSRECEIEGVIGRCLATLAEMPDGRPSFVPVLVDAEGALLSEVRPPVLVDGRMAKRNLGTRLDQAALVIGLGPGFVAGEDVHAVVETQRGPTLGRVIWQGAALPDTGRPAPVLGYEDGRVLRAPTGGVFHGRARIGDLIDVGCVVGMVGDQPVTGAVSGLLRGLIADGACVERGTKVGDIDPRGQRVDPAAISDKARAVAAGVVEAVVSRNRGGGVLF